MPQNSSVLYHTAPRSSGSPKFVRLCLSLCVYIYRETERQRERDTDIHESIVTARLDDKQSFLERERERERGNLWKERDN